MTKYILFLTLLTNMAFGDSKIIIEHIESLILEKGGIPTYTVVQKVEKNKTTAAKQQVRNILAKKHGIKPDSIRSGKDIVEAKKAQIRAEIKERNRRKKLFENNDPEIVNSWIDEKREEQDSYYKRNLDSINNFLDRIKKAKNNYKKNKDNYINGLSETPVPKPVESDQITFPSQKMLNSLDKKIIKGGLEVRVKDQGKRPTCSAFAAVNAIEILAYQRGLDLDLSEQYFYWASKPKCQKSPCTDRGSWVGHGLNYSKRSNTFDIPTEKTCNYIATPKLSNDTQIPLSPGCFEGKAKIKSFNLTRNVQDIITALNSDLPVIAGTKLNQAFFENDGLILSQTFKEVFDLESNLHSKGHAYTIIGYMKLPEKLHKTQGKFCFLINNSWSEGWGFGGRACASEEWVRENLNKSPFVILEDVKFRS